MEWTLDEFYKSGGTTSFVDRVAASLGIHASSIKIVGVYEGSLIVDYNIFVDNDSEEELEALKVQQTELIATNAMDLGAPVLDFEAGGESVVSDGVVSAPGYEPIRITLTNTNGGSSETENKNTFATNTQQTFDQKDYAEQGSVFNPDISIVEEESFIKQQEAEARLAAQANGSSAPIIIGALAVVALVVILLACRMIIANMKIQSIEAERMKQVKQDFEKAEENSLDQFRSPGKFNIKVGPTDEVEMNTTNGKMLKQYQTQYDANHDFQIFGCGDGAQGGIQTLQQKMNIADKDSTTSQTDARGESTNSQSNGRGSSQGLEEDIEIVE